MKTIELIKTQLKGFVRNYRTVILLLGVPLLLIVLIISSFSTQGVTGIPFGVVEQDVYNLGQYEDSYLSFLDVQYFPTTEVCLRAVDFYWVYGCIEITQDSGPVQVTVHYDNTREPIIWEVLQRIETTIEALQKQESERAIQGLLNETASTSSSVEFFAQGIGETRDSLSAYRQELLVVEQEVSRTRSELSQQLSSSEREIADVEQRVRDYDMKRANTYSLSRSLVFDARRLLTELPPGEVRDDFDDLISDFEDGVEQENDQALDDIREAQEAISRFEQVSAQGRGYVSELGETRQKIFAARQQLLNQQSELLDYQREISSLRDRLDGVGSMDADAFLNTIVLSSTPTFIPDFSNLREDPASEVTAQEVNQARSLMSLQTLYPTILMLLLLFLSLLISSFLCLQEINNQASKRIRLIPYTFHAELISTYVASLFITIIPIVFVLIAGDVLFMLDIFSNLLTIVTILLLLASCYIFVGMALAYMFRSESITLLLSTLLLIFVMFFSGFLFPTERMNDAFSLIANVLPPKIGFEAFSQVVFYQGSFLLSALSIGALGIWMVFFASAAVITKLVRQSQ